jgi:hypothetical protein
MSGPVGRDRSAPVGELGWHGRAHFPRSEPAELTLRDACGPPWRAGDPPRFPLGRTVVTTNAASVLADSDIVAALSRHVRGDWGELDKHDRAANDRALVDGGRILSAYQSSNGIRFWIITEWDRSVTTVLLPEDY